MSGMIQFTARKAFQKNAATYEVGEKALRRAVKEAKGNEVSAKEALIANGAAKLIKG